VNVNVTETDKSGRGVIKHKESGESREEKVETRVVPSLFSLTSL